VVAPFRGRLFVQGANKCQNQISREVSARPWKAYPWPLFGDLKMIMFFRYP